MAAGRIIGTPWSDLQWQRFRRLAVTLAYFSQTGDPRAGLGAQIISRPGRPSSYASEKNCGATVPYIRTALLQLRPPSSCLGIIRRGREPARSILPYPSDTP